MKLIPNPSFIFQNGKNQIYKKRRKPIMKNKNEKYFLNSLHYASCHAAPSFLRSSGRITRDIRFSPRLGLHPNCTLQSQLRIPLTLSEGERSESLQDVPKIQRILSFRCSKLGWEKEVCVENLIKTFQ